MLSYDIAGVNIDVESDRLVPLDKMSAYRRERRCSADIHVDFSFRKNIVKPEGSIMTDYKGRMKWLKKTSGSRGVYIYFTEENSDNIQIMVDITDDWRKIKIICRDYYDENSQDSFSQRTWNLAHLIIGMVFRYRLLYLEGIVIHSSALKHRGQAVVFSAPSGTGKSTHVSLWHKYIKDVKTLNDDTPAVRIINGRPYIFGTPWSGSAMINSNDSAPLKAVVVLEQAKENKIRRINGQEVILSLLPRTFLPHFDTRLLEKSVSLFERIILDVPVYLMQCRPDQEAVEMAYQCLY